jgi:biopolymer transport protein ExbD
MQIQSEDKPYDDINITPMLDLAYVLLVIFILLTTASVQGAKVDLPKASATQNLAQPKTQVISVKPDGQMTLNETPVSLAELDRKLRDAKAGNPNLPVIIKGDRAAQYEKIMNVLDLCGRVGIGSVGLASSHVSGS